MSSVMDSRPPETGVASNKYRTKLLSTLSCSIVVVETCSYTMCCQCNSYCYWSYLASL